MKAPGIVERHPELRWLASLAVVAVAAALLVSFVSGAFRDEPSLPATSPEQLAALVRQPHAGGYSGTIVTQLQLGLPRRLRAAFGAGTPGAATLLDGSHTLRYWYGGAQQQRVAVVEQTAEQDVFRNGSQLVLWDTRTRVAERTTLPTATSALPLSFATPAALTPPQLAARVLDAMGSSSDTMLRSGDQVADRPTYELVVRPVSPESRVREVRIEVDGATSVPLAVQIYAGGAQRPSVAVSFTNITFGAPSSRNFVFRTPENATMRTVATPGPLGPAGTSSTTSGSGWLTTVATRVPRTSAGGAEGLLGPASRAVKGPWGSGRLLQTPLLCVLATTSGELVAGAVQPGVLYRTVTADSLRPR